MRAEQNGCTMGRAIRAHYPDTTEEELAYLVWALSIYRSPPPIGGPDGLFARRIMAQAAEIRKPGRAPRPTIN